MNKLLIFAIAFSFIGINEAKADSEKHCWDNRQTLQQAIEKNTDVLFAALKDMWYADRSIQLSLKLFNPVINNGRPPSFSEAVSAATHRVCLLNYTKNLEQGFNKCVAWSTSKNVRKDRTCGANYNKK